MKRVEECYSQPTKEQIIENLGWNVGNKFLLYTIYIINCDLVLQLNLRLLIPYTHNTIFVNLDDY